MLTTTKNTIQNQAEKQAKIIAGAIKKKLRIDQLAQLLGKSINQTVSELNLYTKNSQIKDIFEELGWLLKFNSGHIFTKDKCSTVGENKLKLSPGDHVIAIRSIRGNRYCEIFKPVYTIKAEIVVKKEKRDQNGKLQVSMFSEYFTKSEIQDGKHKEWVKSFGANKFILTDKRKIEVSRGEWLGCVSVRAVIALNHNWR